MKPNFDTMPNAELIAGLERAHARAHERELRYVDAMPHMPSKRQIAKAKRLIEASDLVFKRLQSARESS